LFVELTDCSLEFLFHRLKADEVSRPILDVLSNRKFCVPPWRWSGAKWVDLLQRNLMRKRNQTFCTMGIASWFTYLISNTRCASPILGGSVKVRGDQACSARLLEEIELFNRFQHKASENN